MPRPFALQFDPAGIGALAGRFGADEDGAATAVGAAARARGHYTRSEFLRVCAWKSPRSRPRAASNSARAIRAATAIALAAEATEAERMAALLDLEGVGVPTASTLLYMAFPHAYPILDVRALEALGHPPRSTYPVSYWLGYLDACRALAERHGVSLRTLDKALWQWSKERSRILPAADP